MTLNNVPMENSTAHCALLQVRDLSVRFGSNANAVDAVRGVSFDLHRGETLALVGESGSGKSVTALSILRLLPYPHASHPSGSVQLDGLELLNASPRQLRGIRGNRIGMIFQEPMTSLNPLHTVRKQIGEVLALHRGLRGDGATDRVVELLDLVGIRDPRSRLDAYPHQLSGGQRQRVMIAMALANEPELLIADEPTTALDVTIQAQVLELLHALQQRLGMAMLFITHDLNIVRKFAHRVAIMRRGEIVETGATAEVFARPTHQYTQELLAADPSGVPSKPAADAPVVLEANDVKVWFPIKRGLLKRTVAHIKAVDGVSLKVRAGQTIGVVGESGSGKTTLGLAILKLESYRGSVRFKGHNLDPLRRGAMRPLRREMQMIFQDPYGSLSPRMSVGDIVAEGLKVHSIAPDTEARDEIVVRALSEVGLDPETRHRYPHEFSGGQRQRIAIARAIVLEPELIVLDEPTSALDRSVQAQIVDLLRDLQMRRELAYIFISHDLAVIRALCDEIIVMRQGKVVESGSAEVLFRNPSEPYTQTLMAAAFDLEAKGDGVVGIVKVAPGAPQR